ncbi:hypothetical protein [Sphingobium sp. Ant17]|uniref:hypothetical protein n=1 Tax=Sphingobium sp. Ant17 TaxID=1461752 RepID=UPI000446D2D1|nr:hypothetical protein [Sphingobium sp. Ant17]EXS70553.1 hypothetical protein BF95_16170 [Sphingobium sp. Ant17]
MKPATLIRSLLSPCLILAANSAIFPASAQQRPVIAQPVGAAAGLTYADIVDLADAAPMVAIVRIRNIIALKPDQATGVAPGHKRLFVEADVTSLIRGEAGISPLVTYLYDVRLDARGKIPKLKKAQVILFARPAARPGEVQLIAPDAQIPATPVQIDRVKSVLSALVAPNTPPRILGLGDAFHVAGTIAGEGETQIFLRTENGDPVSLSVLRRPGQPPRWAVALGEIVDEAARAPEPGTLLWHRLACSLPPALPPRAVRTLAVADAEAARADYRLVIDALGPCERTRASS